MTIDELVERLTATTKPDRELDDEIATQIWGEPEVIGSPGAVRSLMWHQSTFIYYSISPEFTGSVDIALTLLVPEGWTVASIGQDDNKAWHVSLHYGYRTSYGKVELGGPSPTPALALGVAALKARRAMLLEAGPRRVAN